jgi:CheY-like chemotaxis protein
VSVKKRRRPRVLVVEDTELSRDLLEQMLEEEFELEFAADGETALTMVREGKFELVLMDLSLPKLDGLTVTQRLRDDPATAKLPVIAVTAHGMRGDREKALEAGCDEHIVKPVDEEKLLAAMRTLLAR